MFGRVPIERKPDARNFSVRHNKYPPPEAGIFDSPTRSVCINQEWIPFVSGVIEVLETGQYWEGDEEAWKHAQQEIWKLLEALAGVNDSEGCGSGEFGGDEICNEYTPNSFVITYAPNDPFQTPDHTPLGYDNPPWKAVPFDVGQPPEYLLNYENGDVIFSMFDQRPNLLIDFLGNVEQVAGIIQNGVPRFQIRFQGQGTVELHLLKIPFGGQAYIVLDNQLHQPKTVDLNSLSISENVDLQSLIQTFVSGIAAGFFSVPTHIHEVEINTAGEHKIDVYMLPNISLDGLFSWGGGLRKVVLCNQELVGVANQMPQFQVNPTTFQMEWKPSELHTTFEPIGQVIYPVHMRVENDDITDQPKIQYTLQPLEIGGGADPFEEWVDLLDMVTPQFRMNNQNFPSFVEWKLAGEEEWTKLFDVPTGVNDVFLNETIEGVPASATYEPETGLLTLNLPPAKDGTPAYLRVLDNMIQYANSFDTEQELIWTDLVPLSQLGFSAVYVEMEDPDDAAFTSLVDRELTIHIPRARDFQGLMFRINAGWLQWKYSNAEDDPIFWTDIFPMASLQGAQGPAGPAGADGQDGIDGQDGDRILQVIANTLSAGSQATVTYDALGGILYFGIPRGDTGIPGDCDCESTMPYATGMSNDQRRCNIAIGLNDWLFAQFQAIVVACSGTSDDLTALQLMFDIIPQSDWEQATLFNLAGRFRVSVVNDVNALMTTGNKELFQEWMYCNLAGDAILDPPTVNEYLGEVETILGQSLVSSLYEDFVDGLTFTALNNQAAIASYQNGDCSGFDCGPLEYDWCWEWDFTTGTQGFGIVQGYENLSMGQYSTGIGFETTNHPYVGDVVYIAKAMSGFAIQAMEIQASGQCYAMNSNQWIEAGNRTPANFAEVTGNSQHLVNWTISSGLYFIAPNTITKVRIWGMGENPLGESNC